MIRTFLLLLSLGCSFAFAETNSRKEIENYAESLVFSQYSTLYKHNKKQKTSIKVISLNKRITYVKCLSDFSGEIVSGKLKKNISVKVTCDDPQSWFVYVRVRLELLFASVTTTQAIRKGETLDSNNLEVSYLNKSQLRGGSFSELAELTGSRLKRNLAINKIIKNRDICFVCREDKVTISAIKTGLVIKTSGIALNDANIGETVRVKNSRTQRIIIGTVSALREVQVTF